MLIVNYYGKQIKTYYVTWILVTNSSIMVNIFWEIMILNSTNGSEGVEAYSLVVYKKRQW